MKEISLLERSIFFPEWIIYTLLVVVILFSVVKLKRDYAFVEFKYAIYKPLSSIHFSKDDLKYLGKLNWIFLTSYIIVSSIVSYLILSYYEIGKLSLTFIPVIYYFLINTSLICTGILSGELKRLRDNIILSNLITHTIGIIFIPILLIWLLHPSWTSYMIAIFVVVFLIMHALRIIRGVYIAISNKISWYYIILYLCTFEIWSLGVVYLLLVPYL